MIHIRNRANHSFLMSSFLLSTAFLFSQGFGEESHQIAFELQKKSSEGWIPVDSRRLTDETALIVRGLNRDTLYTITLTKPSWDGNHTESKSKFTSDSNGIINTGTMAPSSGSYQGVDPDGPFWSMAKTESAPAPSDPGSSYTVEISHDSNVVAQWSFPFEILSKETETRHFNDRGAIGQLFVPKMPEDQDQLPGIIILSGSEGGLNTSAVTAAALANQGYVTLALAWFGVPGLPDDLSRIPLEYVGHAIDDFAQIPEVNSSKIAIMGTSRGSELALQAATIFPKVSAVVARVPSVYRWAGNVNESPMPSAWLHQGEPLPFLNVVGDLEPVTLEDGTEAVINTPAFERGLADATEEERMSASIPLEQIQGPLLFLGGEDDMIWPSCHFVELAAAYLKNRSHPFKSEFYCAPNAGHGVTSEPGWPTTQQTFKHPHMGAPIYLGGTPKDNAKGQREHWEKTLKFFERVLKPRR